MSLFEKIAKFEISVNKLGQYTPSPTTPFQNKSVPEAPVQSAKPVAPAAPAVRCPTCHQLIPAKKPANVGALLDQPRQVSASKKKVKQAQVAPTSTQSTQVDAEYFKRALETALGNCSVNSSFQIPVVFKNPVLNAAGQTVAPYTMTVKLNPTVANPALKQKIVAEFLRYVNANRPALIQNRQITAQSLVLI